ncbi:LytTR family transcriptional regulator DNA-binding domain-containing protein [uncultured Tenacibaculum sp.]|uniref:LytR/AlgR family response regulator transcription factor n=1 Tax=uncultured Tenacibaculum sp. TaxID=174713 RepID=UPI0026132CF1|nr:LytTR family transcriptional regulator DNA-binding domain-containing protein [uncultured Tenacibaculum sp.]
MRVLIVEDVTLVADKIIDLTKTYLKGCKVTVAYTLEEAQYCITEEVYDLLFLDLNLNGKSGFELLKSATAASFQTIIITANREKAAMAFDFGVLDFLCKPIIEERFKMAIDRFLVGNGSHREKLKYLTIKSKGKISLIAIKDIAFIKASGNYSEVYTVNNSNFLHDKNLEKLLKILPDDFMRVHRSYIVGKSKINNIIKHGAGKYEVQLMSGEIVPLSRTMYKALLDGC